MVPITVVESELAAQFHQSGPASVPAYQRVKNLIAEGVRSGHWSQGQQLPSENQLVSALGLSRMTINRALRELTHEGLIVRRAGLGTFVAEPKAASALLEVRNIADDIRRHGHRHRTEVVYLREEPAVAADPELGASRVFHSLIVHFEDDTPIQLEDRYVNPEAAPHYLERDFTRETPHAYLNAVAPLTRGEHVVEAVLATPEERRLLRTDRHEPCLLIRRRTWSSGTLVSVATLLHPGSRHRLEGSFGES
ncbi:histidine utilization repressor [Bailinhaonella thermotolerans]|uniref:Histidine utilization repressor n=1 Tax=Bailinhaonella thermotolerans TaxID=1070861 RepID=A0A3A4A141_9ACTN|nr:histidine utilization repressor [Bailinhaonella thermotolerans]RJL20690.1 histidine utilization repressor [Bailinhaonella thermotolerans]